MRASQTIQIQGMHCQSCVSKVSQALAPFAEHVEVTLQPPQAVLHGSQAKLKQLQDAVAQVGKYQLSLAQPATPKQQAQSPAQPAEEKSWLATYQPLLILFAYLLATSSLMQLHRDGFSSTLWMQDFMAMFFLVFSFFKMLDIPAFANSYAMYDLLAMRVKSYGYVYPFIELGLGLAYLTHINMSLTHSVTLVVMGFSSLGVIQSVMRQQKIRCACLGTVFNLPMSSVTIIEDLLMVVMAGWMLLQGA